MPIEYLRKLSHGYSIAEAVGLRGRGAKRRSPLGVYHIATAFRAIDATSATEKAKR